MKQILPAQSEPYGDSSGDPSGDRYDADCQMFLDLLAEQGNDATWYTQAFNPYPIELSSFERDEQSQLHKVLFRAINQIVTNYFFDERVQAILSLPKELLSVLQLAREHPYRVGSFRPDFLHSQNGGIVICEINARFPANAYFISHYINNIVDKLKYLNPLCAPLPGLSKISHYFLRGHKPGTRCSIIKGREKGWDIHFFKYEMERAGLAVEWQDFCGLQARDGKFYSDQEMIDYLVLELHQDELLHSVSPTMLAAIADNIECLNDLRTIFLVHDKRFLAVLGSQEIVSDYLSPEDSLFLSEHVVPTYSISVAVATNSDVVEESLANQQDWVLKPNLLGKGEGVVFGKNLDFNTWRRTIEEYRESDYVLQRYIPQAQYSLINACSGVVARHSFNVVGTLLCFDDVFFGPGIYRASAGDIVNVAGGGTVLFPVLTAEGEK